MATKSPTTSVRSREIIGVEQFSQRREVFDKYDTVFLPPLSPVSMVPANDPEPGYMSNHTNSTPNFKRNAPAYSSMRESGDRNIEFRTRKYSDNFTSELNQNDDVDYRYSVTERTRRLSKLRREFLNSNLHEPSNDSPFVRTGVRASVPASTTIKYKIESPNLYKFPFAERYATPPPVRRVVVDLGPAEVNGEKENRDPEAKPNKHQSLPNNDTSPKVDHQKLFEELIKRYSPQRKPVNWNLPPTRPRVVGSVPKSFSSVADSVDSADKKTFEENLYKSDDDVFLKKENNVSSVISTDEVKPDVKAEVELEQVKEIEPKVPQIVNEVAKQNDVKQSESKSSLAELEEKNDEVPELSTVPRASKELSKKPLEKYTELTLPALLNKMTEEAEESETHTTDKKVKRKRSFLDKLLGRKKKEK